MIRPKPYILLLLVVFTRMQGIGQSRWSFDLNFGVVHTLDLPLVIKQAGYPDIRINKADFTNESLIDPPYWCWKFSKWFNDKSIELEAVHHKFYLEKDLPPEVERFGVSHGYNMFTINHSRVYKKYIFRFGLGSALVHGESTVRGLKYYVGPDLDIPGYRLRGVTLNLAVARQLRISRTFYFNTEFKVHGAVANIPIVNGHARMHIVAFQFIVGPGVNWLVRDQPVD